MLVVVLLLVLAAGGALVSAVVADHPQWAWLSVLFSVLGAALLAARRIRRRKVAESTSESGATSESSPVLESSEQGPGYARGMAQPANAANQTAAAKDGGTRSFGATAVGTAGTRAAPDGAARDGAAGARRGATGTRVVDTGSASPFFDEEPGDEGTDATVLLQGSELYAEVVVIDERPRYHLGRCRWLGNRTTIPLGLREARNLGFTPCALCAPNAVLTRRARVSRGEASRGGVNPS